MQTQNISNGAAELAEGIKTVEAAACWQINVSDDYDRTIKVELPDVGLPGAGLRLSISPYNHKGRVVIHGTYPDGAHPYQVLRHNDQVSEITVALSRGPAAIVKEIVRRYLPDYLSSYAKCVEAKQRADDYQARKEQDLSDLAAILGVSVGDDYPGHKRERAYYNRENVRVEIKDTYNGTTQLEMSVPMSLARRLLAMVAES